LDSSDFQIVEKELDIRGWDVKTNNGQKIGEVEELIVDAPEKKVRYMVVDLDDNKLKLEHRKVLIPIGLAELDRDKDDVLIPNISPEQFSGLPVYDRDHLTPDVERRICSTLERQKNPTTVRQFSKPENQPAKTEKANVKERNENDEISPEFYRHENYNLDNLYKNRLHEARPAQNKNESEYERSLKLWERRSEGGIVSDSNNRDESSPARDRDYYRDMDEDTRRDMVRRRRSDYEKKRYGDENDPRNRNETTSDRPNDEDIL
jgi:sporulation protein YlmC with PRC-barrel domain